MTPQVDLTRVETLVNPLLERESVELVDLRYLRESGSWRLRFYLDKPGGITLDDCERLSRKMEALLDMEDVMPSSYTLEVSSPGLDRVLKREADFARFAGQRVRIRLRVPREGQRNFKGTLSGAADGKVVVESEGRSLTLPLCEIEEARLDPEIRP